MSELSHSCTSDVPPCFLSTQLFCIISWWSKHNKLRFCTKGQRGWPTQPGMKHSGQPSVSAIATILWHINMRYAVPSPTVFVLHIIMWHAATGPTIFVYQLFLWHIIFVVSCYQPYHFFSTSPCGMLLLGLPFLFISYKMLLLAPPFLFIY